jgi:hypothetical protein
VQARGIKLQQNALPCPKTATLRNLDEPGCGRGATAFAARVNARQNLTASLTEAARLAKKAQICLLIVENVQEHPPFRPSSHSNIQAMQTFKPCRPSKQY